MGTGIAIVASLQKSLRSVFIFDQNQASASNALSFADAHFARSVLKGRIDEKEKAEALQKMYAVPSLKSLAEQSDFIIEAASEVPSVKCDIFNTLDQFAPQGVILATNTSSISITKIGAATKRAENVIGMHFFYPVPVMQLVEIIPGLATSDATVAETEALARALGKTVARAMDSAGFISNRLLMPYINEAILALSEGVGTKEDIDAVMKLGTGVPMGPLTLADFIGLDTCLSILNILHADLGLDKYAPAPLLVRHVAAGWLGRKAGRGFYVYDDEAPR